MGCAGRAAGEEAACTGPQHAPTRVLTPQRSPCDSPRVCYLATSPLACRRRYASIPPALQGAQCFSRQLALEEQGVLDGELLAQYLRLPRRQQEGAAEAAGLERAQLLELLQGLWRAGGTLL